MIKDLEDEFASLLGVIAERMIQLGLKAQNNVNRNFVWVVDETDPLRTDIMAFASCGSGDEYSVEVRTDAITIKPPEDEMILQYDYAEGLRITGVTLAELPFLRYLPKLVEAADHHYDKQLQKYLSKLESQPVYESPSGELSEVLEKKEGT